MRHYLSTFNFILSIPISFIHIQTWKENKKTVKIFLFLFISILCKYLASENRERNFSFSRHYSCGWCRLYEGWCLSLSVSDIKNITFGDECICLLLYMYYIHSSVIIKGHLMDGKKSPWNFLLVFLIVIILSNNPIYFHFILAHSIGESKRFDCV